MPKSIPKPPAGPQGEKSQKSPTGVETFRSGFVCLVGRPNVGKSTLMNRLVGHQVSITTAKPQTTRTRILGVRHGEGCQTVFMDTPGIHQATSPLNKRMVEYALGALGDADLALVLMEPRENPQAPPGAEEALVLERVAATGRPALGVVNKMDVADEQKLLGTLSALHDTGLFQEVIPVSALTGRNLNRLIALIEQRLKPGPQYFPEDQVTDQSGAVLVSELVRLALFNNTRQEVPYSCAVKVERLEEEERLVRIHAVIYVERESQKGILIGKRGVMLKKVGMAARKRIEHFYGRRVYLELHVGVLAEWSTDPRRLAELGYPSR
ncbi:MAG: GTPase Era [Deltaproteobacteria bacterium]|nr:GTPase Era [Deltaproteobacteria bacterium]